MVYPLLLLLASITVTVADWKACYETELLDQIDSFRLSSSFTLGPNNTATDCARSCAIWSKSYAGIRDGVYCFCDDFPPAIVVSNSTSCDALCPSGSQVCGDVGLLVMYDSISLSQEIQLRIDTLAARLTPGRLTFVVKPNDFPQVSTTLLEGDSRSEVSQPFEVAVGVPGEHTVVIETVDQTANTHLTSIGFTVYDQNLDVTLECPSTAELYEEVECHLSIQSAVPSTIDINGDTISSMGGFYSSYGPNFPQADTSSAIISNTMTSSIMMPLSEVTTPGILRYWVVWGQTAGNITLEVLEPSSCPGYCYALSNCTASCNPTERVCNSAEFCSLMCGCCSPSVSSSDRLGKMADFTYSTVHQENLTISEGPNVYPLVTPIEVNPGNILRLKMDSGGVVAQLNSSGTGADYEELLNQIVTGSPIADRYLVQAVALTAETFTLPMSFNESGYQHVNVTFTDSITSSTVSRSAQIEVPELTTTTILPTTSTAGVITTTTAAILPTTSTDAVSATTTASSGTSSSLGITTPSSLGTTSTGGLPTTTQTVTATPVSQLPSNQLNVTLKMSGIAAINSTQSLDVTVMPPANYSCTLFLDADLLSAWSTSPLSQPITLTHTQGGFKNITAICTDSNGMASDSARIFVDSEVNQIKLAVNMFESGQPGTLVFTLPSNSVTGLTTSLDGVGLPTLTYDNLTMRYSAAFSSLPAGVYDFQIAGNNYFGPFTRSTQITVINAASLSSVTTNTGTFNSVTQSIEGALYENITTSGLTLGFDVGSADNISTVVDWGDGVVELHQCSPTNVSHVYATGGDFMIHVIVVNAISEFNVSIELIVVNPLSLTNLVLRSTRAIFTVDGKFRHYFEFLQIPNTDVYPNQAEAVFLPGTGEEVLISPLISGDSFYFEYDAIGSYHVSATITNSRGDEVTLNSELNFTWPIVDMQLSIIPEHTTPTSIFTVGVTILKGDNVTYIFDMGDGTMYTCQRNESTVLSAITHSYASVGIYMLNVTAVNEMGSIEMIQYIHCEKQVSESLFLITTNAPVPHPGVVEIGVSYIGSADDLPTSPVITLSYGNGEYITVPLNIDAGNRNATFTKTFTEPGSYFGVLGIANKASSATFEIEISSIEPIENLTAGLAWRPQIPLNSPLLEGLVDSNGLQMFPVGYQLNFSSTVRKGAPIYSSLDILNKDTNETWTVETDGSSISFVSQMAGVHEVNFTIYNGLSSFTESFTFSCVMPLTGLAMADTITVAPNASQVYSIIATELCQSCCLAVEFGDETPATYYSPDGLLSSHCLNMTISGLLSFPLSLPHTYQLPGNYFIRLTLSQPFIKDIHYTRVVSISSANCGQPLLSIDDQRDSFLSAAQKPRSAFMTILAYTELRCSDTIVNTKYWKVYKLDENTGERNRTIDISELATWRTAQLSLPKRFLHYGIYELEYSVAMENSEADLHEGFFHSTSTFIEIIRSPIIARLLVGGPSRVTRASDQQFTIEPAIASIDPDLASGQLPDLIKFEWFCARYPEEFPLDLATGDLRTEPRQNSGNSRQVTTDYGGCYGKGPGALNISDGSTVFNASLLLPDFTHHLLVRVTSADGRVATGSLLIDIQMGLDQPIVSLRCADGGICRQVMEGQMVNPTNRLALWSECLGLQCVEPIQYHWSIYYLDQYSFWRRILDSENFIEGSNSRGIGVKLALFQHSDYSHITQFKFEVTIRSRVGAVLESQGNADMIVFINSPPKDGNCTLYPHSADNSTHKFDIYCYGWRDEGRIVKYELYDDSGDTHTLLYYNNKFENDTISLPSGEPSNDYKLNLTVRIIDEFFSFALYRLEEVTVVRGSMTQVWDEMKQLFENSFELELVMEKGEITEVAAQVLQLSQVLNQASSSLLSAMGSLPIAQQIASGSLNLNPTNNEDLENTTLALNSPTAEDSVLLFESTRNSMSKLREVCLKGMDNIGTGSIESLTLFAGAMKVITDGVGELNLNSQTYASDILSRLADQLLDQTEDIPQEEIVAVAKDLIFSIDNVLKGSSIQLDHPILDDFIQARKVMDYDTDLESAEPWMDDGGSLGATLDNLQTFTSGKIQKSKSQSVVGGGLNDMDKIGKAMLHNMVPGESSVSFTNPSVEFKVEKNTVNRLSNKTYSTQGSGSVDIPTYCDLRPRDCVGSEIDSQDDIVSLQVVGLRQNPFSFDSKMPSHYDPNNIVSKTSSAGSSSIQISYLNTKLKPLSIKNTLQPFRMFIPNNPGQEAPFKNRTVPDSRERILVNELVDIQSDNVAVFIEFANVTEYTELAVYIKFTSAPDPISGEYDAVYIIDVSDSAFSAAPLMIPQDVVNARTGSLYISFAPLTINVTRTGGLLDYLEKNATFTYEIRINTAGCYYFDEKSREMKSDGCKVGPGTNSSTIECLCDHLTTFAGGWIVAPNTINFTQLNFDPSQNVAIYITLSLIIALYIMMVIWARRKDRKDVATIGCVPLDCNDPIDKYLYEVIISTGSRKSAGTKSKVYVILSGESDETTVLSMKAEGKTLLQRGSSDSLLLSTPRPLGSLQYMRIWHDNSGPGKYGSWYLNYVAVRDLQTKEKWFFVANRWLAVEEGDGEVDRVIPVAGTDDLTNFSHLFTESSKANLSDGHLWFSVFMRPAQSRFTRVQRVSCCLMLLMLSMVTSGMFYEAGTSIGTDTGVSIGPLTLTPQQVSIGFMSNLIVFPMSLIVIQLFRKSKLRYKRKSHLIDAINENARRLPDYYYSNTNFDNFRVGSAASTVVKKPAKSPPKRPFYWPWWCRIVAWILLWIATLVAAAFTLLYAVEFGNNKTTEWLTSMVISFISNIFITQPIQVFLTAIFFSLIIRSPKDDTEDDQLEDENDIILDYDEEWLHESAFSAPFKALQPNRMLQVAPPKPEILSKQRERRLKEIKMYDIIREMLIYLTFVMVIVVITDSTSNILAYNYKSNLDNSFIKKGDLFNQDYTRIRNSSNFWYWMRETLIPGLRAESWYNGQPPVSLRGFLEDKTSRIMGYATIRQLRMTKYSCPVNELVSAMVKNCVDKYSMKKEDKTDYGPGWKMADLDPENYPEFVYREANELDGSPYVGSIEMYSGGGYTLELRGTVEHLVERSIELERLAWVDKYTRAIVIEFTVYNPGTNLFAICVMLIECPPSSSMIPKWRFDVVRLLQYYGSFLIFNVACHSLFVLFIIGFMVKEGRNLKKSGTQYFTSFWNLLELAILLFSVCAIALYIGRYIHVNRQTSKFKETNGNSYMKFQTVLLWAEWYTYMIAMLVFLTIIKFIKLLRFNKKVGMLSDTLRNSAKSLIQFAIMAGIVFFTFVQFFHIILVKDMLQFASILNAFQTSVAMMLGKFDFQAMTSSNPLAPIFFFCFMVVNVFILLNMFLSIINESFTVVKNDLSKQSNEHEMVDFVIDKFKLWTGIGKIEDATLLRPDEILDNDLDIECADSVGQFPVRIEMLMASLKRFYIEGEKWHSYLDNKCTADSMANVTRTKMLTKRRFQS